MRRAGLRGLARVVRGGGRRTRPGRLAVGVLALVVVALAAAGAAVLAWATRSASPARTLALAAGVLPRPPALDSALEVTWARSVGDAGDLEDRWLGLVAPTLPPGICAPGRPSPQEAAPDAAEGPTAQAVDGALRELDGAVARGADTGELERRLEALRDVGTAAPGSRTAFVVRYALARGYAAAGDWAAAAEVLEPALSGWIGLHRVPETDRGRALAAVESGRMDETLALDAVHGRYLAATVAYRRGEADRAVTLFRRTINAFHYLLAVRRDESLGPDGHDQRVVAGLGDSRCPGLRADEALTSLDAYAGLVAAYMAHEDFRDPSGLPAEVARTRLQIDPDDPFGPVLEHARRTGGNPRRTPVPENLLWAASNLQRVYHNNRLRPEPRLEVTRAVLLLHLTARPVWAAALRDDGGADVCGMLAGVAGDLRRDAERSGRGGPTPTATAADSARAAVAIQAFARVRRECGPREAPPVDPAVRSAWIRLGGAWLGGGVGATYEEARIRVAETLGETGAPPAVLEDRLAPVLERIRAHRSALRRNRLPAELPAGMPAQPVARFVEAWWRAIWLDVAEGLAARVRDSAAEGAPVRAGEVPALLTALESAVDHAGARPERVYAVGETAALASAGGKGPELAWRVRTAIRNRPVLAAAALGGVVLALSLVALLVHVGTWRYRLLVQRRFYRDEEAERGGAWRRAA